MHSREDEKLASLMCLTKKHLESIYVGSPLALKTEIQRAIKNKNLLKLKNGLYVNASHYLKEPDKVRLHEMFSTKIYTPSYLSLEYALQKYNLLPFKNYPITAVTVKNKQEFENFAGIYKYQKTKESLYFGFNKLNLKGQNYNLATKAKALFDYLYLKPNLPVRNSKKLKKQLFVELQIQWSNFSEEDFQEFDQYVWKSNVKKMMRILSVLSEYFDGKKFDTWAKNLLDN